MQRLTFFTENNQSFNKLTKVLAAKLEKNEAVIQHYVDMQNGVLLKRSWTMKRGLIEIIGLTIKAKSA